MVGIRPPRIPRPSLRHARRSKDPFVQWVLRMRRLWRNGLLYAGVLVVSVEGVGAVGDLGAMVLREDNDCRVWRVVDGDTVRVWCAAVEAGQMRLQGFDTPEMKGRCWSEIWRARAARWALRRELWTAGELTFRMDGLDLHGRALAIVSADGVNVASAMFDSGFARPYGGGKRQSWCEGA